MKITTLGLALIGTVLGATPALAVDFDFVGPGSTYLGGGGPGVVAPGGATNFLFETEHFVTSPVFDSQGLTTVDTYAFTAAFGYAGGSGLTETEFFDILLNGNLIGSFSIAPGTGTGTVSGSGSFSAIDVSAGIVLTYTPSQDVTSGAGSVQFFDEGSVFSLTSSGGVVPEPATWAMMIGGMGAAGGALRRRRTVAVSYAA